MFFRILVGATLLLTASAVFALRGKLDKPGLAFPEEYPARQQVMDALNRPGSEFLGGSFINARTVLRYRGNTRALNQFLADLVKCPGALLSVSFVREEEGDWQLEHEGMRYLVRVNLNSRKLKFEELAIPEAKGPPLHAGDPQHGQVFPSFDSGAVAQAASLTWRNYVEWWNKTHGTPLRGDIELTADLWADGIARLKPEYVYTHGVNIVVVRSRQGEDESGFYIALGIASGPGPNDDQFTRMLIAQHVEGSVFTFHRRGQFQRTQTGTAQVSTPSQDAVREIEQLPFDDAFRFWRQENDSLAGKRSRDGSYSIPGGETDSQTGEFTPARIAALECRLGREAHLHKQFLREQLTMNADVHKILEASPRLCEEFGIASKARVEWLGDGRYSHRTTGGWIPQVRQRLWLEALNSS